MIRYVVPMREMIPDKICDQIIREGSRCGDWIESFTKHETEDARVSESVGIHRQDGKFIYENVKEIFNNANRLYGFDVHDDYEIELIRYRKGGEFKWHSDDTPVDNSRMDRKLSMTIQLSEPEDYEGGDLEFKDFENMDIRGRGTVVVFPSYVTHRITPLTSGTRYSLVAWQYGPEWR